MCQHSHQSSVLLSVGRSPYLFREAFIYLASVAIDRPRQRGYWVQLIFDKELRLTVGDISYLDYYKQCTSNMNRFAK